MEGLLGCRTIAMMSTTADDVYAMRTGTETPAVGGFNTIAGRDSIVTDDVVGACVGASVGICVGVSLGEVVGSADGALVGNFVGLCVGTSVGTVVGEAVVGESVGASVVGRNVGYCVGAPVGVSSCTSFFTHRHNALPPEQTRHSHFVWILRVNGFQGFLHSPQIHHMYLG